MDSKSLIWEAYTMAMDKGFNQTRWSDQAGHASNGQTVCRMLKNGDCKLSTFLDLINVLNCRIQFLEEQENERAKD